MPTLFTDGDFLRSEWALVFGIGLVFFLTQIVLSISFSFRLRRQEREIKQLCRDFELGGNGRYDVQRVPGKSTWTHWVISHFPAGAAPRNFTREDALEELDTRIASDGNYLLLQRMGVMAPLLGVVLTVAGFYWLKIGEGDQSLGTILLAVTPLVSGVGTGAVLAIINQALLHFVGRRVESLRMTARTWFDTVIWDNAGVNQQVTAGNVVQVIEHFVKNTLDDIDRLSDTLTRASEISVAMSSLPDQIRSILDRKLVVDHDMAPPDSGEPFVTRLPRTAR